jgi:hypothetical protein
MTRLLITRGLPASGKTTLARRADVIVDDTNLRTTAVREWAQLAARFRATFEVHDLTEVPLAECIRRDAARPDGERVGEQTIRRMHDRYLAGRNLPLPIPYVDPDDPGVLYSPDPSLPPAVLVDIDGTVAVMGDRPAGDNRPDALVKQELFELHVRHRWRVVGVFDDRRQVVRMWRELGLTVFQVAEGDF